MQTQPVRHLFVAIALGAAGSLAAQSLPPAAPPAGKPAAEESLSLDQFVVSSSATSGYRAANSITATGIGAQIVDTPIAINVVTSELLADTAGTELRDALNFVPGVATNPRAESTFIVRGFSGLTAYRNGNYRRQLFPTWNVDRVEVVKGPSAIFFGVTRPGGAINYVTTKPVLGKTFTDAKVTVGDHDYYRGEVFHNQALTDTLAMRVGVGYLDAGGERQFEYKREPYFGASFLWQPSDRQQLTLDLESVQRKLFYLNSYGGRAVSNSRYLFNPAAPSVNQTTKTAQSATQDYLKSLGYSTTAGAANFVPTYDIFAPIYGPNDPSGQSIALTRDADNTFESRTVDLEYLLKLTDELVWQTSLNYGFDDTAGTQPTGGETNAYADGTVRFRFEDWINVRHSFNVDNKLTWRFDLGSTRHTLQLGQELQRVEYQRPGYFDSQSKYNESVYGAYIYNYRPGVDAPVSVEEGMAAGGQSMNMRRDRTDDTWGFYLVNQSRFFDERLHLLYGARYNKFDSEQTYSRPVANANTATTNADGTVNLSDYDNLKAKGAWTPQLGGIVKATKEISFFAVYSKAIEPDYSLDADGNASEPVKSEGYDLGVKTALFDGRLASTVTYYALERGNLKYRDTTRELETGRSPYYLYGNTEESEGIEADINWSPVDNYQLILGWHHFLKAEVTKSNTAANVGQPLAYTPENTLTLWQRYEFSSGPLSGISIGLGARHNDAARINSNPINQVVAPSFTVFDAMVGYKFRVAGQEIRAQLNVKNLEDELYREGADGFFNPRRQFFLSVSTRF